MFWSVFSLMKTVTQSHAVLISASLERVFDHVSDLSRHPEWSGGELTVEAATPGPVRIGKEYISHGEVLIQKDRPNRVRVSRFEPPYRFDFVAVDPSVGEVTHEFTLTEQPDGILVRREMTLRLHPLAAFVFRHLVYPIVGGPSMERAMASLKAKLEMGSSIQAKKSL
jgi:uncharacterized protein YndB with AHSA1/START domain